MIKVKFKKNNNQGNLRKKISSTIISHKWNLYVAEKLYDISGRYAKKSLYYSIPTGKKREFLTQV